LLVVTLPAIAGSAHATGIQSEPAPLAFESDLEQGNANVVVASTPTDGRLVTTAAAEDIQPALSPSPEGRLAFASDSDGNYDIYATAHGTGGERLQVTKDEAPDMHLHGRLKTRSRRSVRPGHMSYKRVGS